MNSPWQLDLLCRSVLRWCKIFLQRKSPTLSHTKQHYFCCVCAWQTMINCNNQKYSLKYWERFLIYPLLCTPKMFRNTNSIPKWLASTNFFFLIVLLAEKAIVCLFAQRHTKQISRNCSVLIEIHNFRISIRYLWKIQKVFEVLFFGNEYFL